MNNLKPTHVIKAHSELHTVLFDNMETHITNSELRCIIRALDDECACVTSVNNSQAIYLVKLSDLVKIDE